MQRWGWEVGGGWLAWLRLELTITSMGFFAHVDLGFRFHGPCSVQILNGMIGKRDISTSRTQKEYVDYQSSLLVLCEKGLTDPHGSLFTCIFKRLRRRLQLQLLWRLFLGYACKWFGFAILPFGD